MCVTSSSFGARVLILMFGGQDWVAGGAAVTTRTADDHSSPTPSSGEE